MRNFYTVVFNGTVDGLNTNPLFVQSPFGAPEHVTNGDVITEVEDLLDVKRDLVSALKECRKVLDALPITVSDTAGVYRCTALIDTAIAKAKNV